jgi:GT2 family glycosyltransferase
LLANKVAIDKVGLLDEKFFMYSEEMDWCYRMWQHGWEVWYLPDVEVIHIGGGSADRKNVSQLRRNFSSKVYFSKKYGNTIIAFVLSINFRISSLFKAFVYKIGAIVLRNDGFHHRARSHWLVAIKPLGYK